MYAWKHKMLHDLTLHDVIVGIFCSWLRPRAVHVLRARFARDEITNSLRAKLRSEQVTT